jgi:TetR/AcrR family acrAB operon transcriptional repressor
MVKKTKEEAQETHAALLNAAEQVFAAKGVTNTTLNDVAQAAGMTRGAIYWHFKDKNALFKAMCDRAFLPMEVLLNEITSSTDDDPLLALRRLNLHFRTKLPATNASAACSTSCFTAAKKFGDAGHRRRKSQARRMPESG